MRARRAGRPARVVVVGGCCAVFGARAALAQQVEARAEAALGRTPAAFAGAGVFVDAGLYARVGLTAAAGATWSDTGGGRRAGAAGEAALVGRFLLDPLRQARRGVYAGAGLGARVGDARPRYFLLAVAGVEGRARGGVTPAVEVGLGGGVRVAVALRRARAGRR